MSGRIGRWWLAAALWTAAAACGGGDGGGAGPADAAADAAGDLGPDGAAGGAAGDVAGDAEGDATSDADGPDVRPPLVLSATLSPPAPPALPAGVETCPIYLDERCEGGRTLRCDLYDAGAAAFVDAPDPLLRRAYLYDRWYDRYTSPQGQTCKRILASPAPGDTPEAVWGAPEAFSRYEGGGDGAIWTGVAMNADIFRYMVTGSEADYQRVETKARQLLRLFDVTGVPGYLARFHFLRMPPGGPTSEELYVVHAAEGTLDHTNMPIESLDVDGLPAAYADGLPGEDGLPVKGEPMWRGAVSIDQYTGPFVAFPLALPLLRDEALKARIVEHLTCYLKRLRRFEVINLQQNPEALEALTAFFGEGTLQRDPDDIDLLAQDRIVGYYHAGLNAKNAATFDRTCPDRVATEPTRVIDAASDDFFLQMLELALDLDAKKQNRPGQMDHFYAVNVRGADASHLIHYAAVAYWLTGEEHYRDFLEDELLGALRADEVALTAAAFRNPPWCYKFYADHISYGTHWQLVTMLPEGPLRDTMVRVMHEEWWQKAMKPLNNAKFNVLFASVVPEAVAGADRAAAVAKAVELLQGFGGNDGVLDAPRRDYVLERGYVVDNLPEGVGVRCPTEAERGQCEDPGTVLGIPLEGKEISYPCDGRPAECPLADGLCAEGMATEGLPSGLRAYGGFTWQLNPLQMGAYPASPGREQSHGRDLAEPYWMARYYGYIPEGAGTLLAWRDVGACAAP